ncbi:MAG: PaaI family thioesterase [Helicobacteraceae bacterium]|jgi:acyl-CoA thioesterase|nr:PaaI family thioesterase [Helicobacteraceae bacterium]
MAEEYENEEQQADVSPVPSDQENKVDLKAYNEIDQQLCGSLEELREGYAKVRFLTTAEMVVDKKGLVHSGFVFGAANFAAAAAVNRPNAILSVARCNFLAPLKVEDEVIFEAAAQQLTARKRTVIVSGYIDKIKVFDGEFSMVITDRHALSLHLTEG